MIANETESNNKVPAGAINSLKDAYALTKSRLSHLPPATCMRRDALALKAMEIGFPSTRAEDWRYTSLRSFLSKNFLVLPEKTTEETAPLNLDYLHETLLPSAVKIVFVDGVLSLGLSDTRSLIPEVSIRTLFESETADDKNWKILDQSLNNATPFPHIAAAFADHGVSIKVGPRPHKAITIHLLHVLTDASKGITRSCRVAIEAARLAEVHVIEEVTLNPRSSEADDDEQHPSTPHVASNKDTLETHLNLLTQLIAREGSSLSLTRVINTVPESFVSSYISGISEKNTRLDFFQLDAALGWSRTDLDLAYQEGPAEITANALCLAGEKAHVDLHSKIDHAVPLCQTKQTFRSILNDSGHSVFNGKVFIRKGSHGSEAYQSAKSLLLSDLAEANTKPELIIENDDVKASHGAAVGSLQPQEIFYLQTRGISKEDAEKILCRGFAREVIESVNDASVRMLLESRLDRYFK